MKNNLKYLLANLFIFLYTTVVFAQFEGEEDIIIGDGDKDGEVPGALPNTPIDMYEGGLLLLAVLLIVGYYFYTRNRKVA